MIAPVLDDAAFEAMEAALAAPVAPPPADRFLGSESRVHAVRKPDGTVTLNLLHDRFSQTFTLPPEEAAALRDFLNAA